MKTHILVCINESMNVVGIEAFPTVKAAEKEMKRQYRAESCAGDKSAPELIEKKITPTTAFVNRGIDWMYS